MNVRIAMTAHSLIYAPLYRAAARLNSNSKRGITVELVFSSESLTGIQKGFGDEGAYEHLCKERSIDLCLADPLVLAEEAWNSSQGRGHQPRAEIIATLLRRPALWALTTPATNASLRRQLLPGKPSKQGTVAYKIGKNRRADTATVNLGRICTYDPGSTAYRIMDYMARKTHFSWDHTGHQQVKIGDEVVFLEKKSSEGVDVVITCDCILPYIYKSTKHPEVAIVFSWHLSPIIDDMPFTALIARQDLREADWAKRSAVAELLREIQWVINHELLTGQHDEVIARNFLDWGMPHIPLGALERLGLGVGVESGPNETAPTPSMDDKILEVTEALLQKLRQRTSDAGTGVSGIFPEDIRPDARWLPAAWAFSFNEIWRVAHPSVASLTEVNRCLTSIINPGPARLACPKTPFERMKTYLFEIFAELQGEEGGLSQAWATLILFVLAVVCTIADSIMPETSMISKVTKLYTPELALGVILLLDLLKASRRRRNRRGEGT